MQPQDKAVRVINHRIMRQIIGAIAFGMPWAVWLLAEEPGQLSSISASYWTDSRDIFVGCLFAVGFFLAAYNGTGKCGILEKSISRFACGFAICIALFPNRIDGAPSWIQSISFDNPHIVHNAAAGLLFVCLFLMLLIFSFRASRKGKARRSITYLVLSLGMLLGLPILAFILNKDGWDDTLFYVEFAGLLLFGSGWVIAGRYKEEVMKVPDGAHAFDPIEVDPSNPNVRTGIYVDVDKEYYFLAEGCWKDLIFRCGPSGWGPKWGYFTRKNRIKGEPVFMLCGSVGQSKDKEINFCISDGNKWSVPDDLKERVTGWEKKDRELILFANDWPDKYENNEKLESEQGGPIKVTIYELKK